MVADHRSTTAALACLAPDLDSFAGPSPPSQPANQKAAKFAKAAVVDLWSATIQRRAKLSVVDLWSATIQRRAKLSMVGLWSATIQRRAKAFCGGPVVSHHPTESQSFPWWTCGQPPSNGEPKLSVVDLWSATIQRRAIRLDISDLDLLSVTNCP